MIKFLKRNRLYNTFKRSNLKNAQKIPQIILIIFRKSALPNGPFHKEKSFKASIKRRKTAFFHSCVQNA